MRAATARPASATISFITLHVANVCRTMRLKCWLNIQNPVSEVCSVQRTPRPAVPPREPDEQPRRHRELHPPRAERGREPAHDHVRGAAPVEQLPEHGLDDEHEGEQQRDSDHHPDEWHRAYMVIPPTVIVVMGPAGSGKSLVGTRLAAALGWPFHEGDAYHPAANIVRMRAGVPLTDADRAPWLAALAGVVDACLAANAPAVLTCSALRRAYRRALVPLDAPAGVVCFVYLRADPALLTARLAERAGHFFAATLLASQLDALEEPGEAAPNTMAPHMDGATAEPAPVLTLDADQAPEALVDGVRRALGV